MSVAGIGYRSVGELVRAKAEQYGEKSLIEFGGAVLSYADFDALTDRVGNAFASLGAKRGDRIVIAMWNDTWALAAWIGLTKIGCWVVFVNPHYRGDSLEALLAKVAPSFVIAHDDVADNVRRTSAGRAAVMVSHALPGSVPTTTGELQLSRVVGEASAAPVPLDVPSTAEVAELVPTGGTTGLSKYCVLTHSHLLAVGLIRIRVLGMTTQDRVMLAMPLYHAHRDLVSILLGGATCILSTKFSVSKYWQEVRDTKATVLRIHDQPQVMLLKQPPGPLDRAHSARVLYPGMRLQRQMHERFGVDIASGYGQVECPSLAIAPWYRPHIDPHYYDSDSPGLEVVSDLFEVMIADDEGKPLPSGEVGEICSRELRPHTRFDGYYQDDERNASAFRDGWFHHGDLGRLDKTGLLHYVGRKGSNIRHRGEWVPPEQVENAANSHPEVAVSAAVGIPTELGDEDIKLYVVRNGDAKLAPDELLDFLKPALPYFMLPRYLEFITEIPRVPGLDKIARRELARSVSDSSWDRESAGYDTRQ